MQGKIAASGTPASLYAQQTQNASLNLIDLFESYKTFREDRDTKMMKTIQQFYDETRYLEIAGDKATEGQILASPDKVRNAEFDISITESVSSPAYRVASNEFLLELFRMGQISLEMLLENGSFPFSDRSLQSINKLKQETQQQNSKDTLPLKKTENI